MPNTIELKLLENKSIVAQMQGIPLAYENSYKIIAGEENSTIFEITSVPNQYVTYQLTVEMVNSLGYGIAETEIVDNQFILPNGMAIAGYGYILIRAREIPINANVNGEVVSFQPLKIKVWNTLPEWREYISDTTPLKIENNHLYVYQHGVWVDVGSVGGGGGTVDQTFNPQSANAQSGIAIAGVLPTKQDTSQRVQNITSSSTAYEYPSAKAVYDFVATEIGNIETALSEV